MNCDILKIYDSKLDEMQLTLIEIECFLKEKMIDAELVATQRKISGPRIQEYCKKLAADQKAPPIKVDKNIIIEGHHRYIAGKIFGRLPESIPWTAPFSIERVLWKDVIVDDLDWGDR